MYWVVLSLFHLVESYLAFILTWIPFYAWMRLFLHLYLVLPGKQGATHLYRTQLEPFLTEHESHIDDLISTSHDRLKAAGLQYLKQAIEWTRVTILGLQPSKQQPPSPARNQSYAQTLLARFNLPSAQMEGAGTGAAGDFYAMLSSALQGAVASNGSRDAQAEDLSSSGTLVPPGLASAEERLSYIAAQRERLRVLLQAFDNEAESVASGRSVETARRRDPEALKKSRSELDFDRIEHDEAGHARPRKQAAGGGWMDWVWGSGKDAAEEMKKTQ